MSELPWTKQKHVNQTDLKGFAAGFVATLVFHQLAVAILAGIGLAPFRAWNLSPVAPLGIPAVLSLSFWGGIWGVILILMHQHFGHGTRYWIGTFLFGGIVTSVVALFIVVPMKGGPMGGGFAPALLMTISQASVLIRITLPLRP